MTYKIVKRGPRRPAPALPSGDVMLEPPPELPQPTGRTWMQILMILPMMAGTGAMALLFAGRGGGALTLMVGGLFGVSMLGMVMMQTLSSNGQPSRAEMALTRRDFMRGLGQQRRRVRRASGRQYVASTYQHPEPARLWSAVLSFRLWERRPGEPDFAVVRVGRGPQQLATRIVPPETRPVEDLEPLCAAALRRFVTTYSLVPDLPVALSLSGFGRVRVTGDRDAARSLVRAMIAQAATFHAPDDLLVAVCAGERAREAWDWVKWLPHAQHPAKVDALGPLRLLSGTVTGLEALIDDLIANRPHFAQSAMPVEGQHVLVVLDDADVAGSDHLMADGGIEGVTVVEFADGPPRMVDPAVVVLDVDGDQASPRALTVTTSAGRQRLGRPDALGMSGAEALARQLAPLRLSAVSRAGGSLSSELGLAELLGIGDPKALDTSRTWAARPNRDRLRVPLGVAPDGSPIELDLKESAQDGMGPHGLLIGATGSGKSELLRTLVLALAVTHPSETLNFVLVDFKGGATFTKLDRLPHTSAVITNLADELSLVDRMTDAINGEVLRRQELLRRAGNFSSQRDYERARVAGAPLLPLPSLLVICDEFSELLSAKPDFIDMFVQIGRVGRSLGVHLLLASQRLEEGRLRGLETHLSYRIGLRTFSAMESRAVLGVTDAYELPRSPGHAFLKTGTDELIRFKAAYVSGTFADHRSGGPADDVAAEQIQDFTSHYVAQTAEDETPEAETNPEEEDVDPLAETLLDVLVDRLQGKGVPAHQVWLPPFDESPTLDQLLPPLVVDPERGLTPEDPELQGCLRTVIGLIDKPFEQRRDLLRVDLNGASGHFLVVGGPQSGKSTVLRTLVSALALTHTPREMQFYLLDFGGGSLTALRSLVHVGGVATRLDVDAARRTVAEMVTLMAWRERYFAEHHVEGMEAYRRALRRGEVPQDPYGDVCLVIDGWLTLRNDFEDLEAAVTDLATRGLSFGVHVLASATRSMDVRTAARDMFGSRVELRLGDPVDSMVARRAAINVPEGTPGRGLAPDGMHVLAGLPRIDGRSGARTVGAGGEDLVARTGAAWTGPPAPRVRLLPARIDVGALPGPREGAAHVVPIGIAENDLGPVFLDTVTDAHFLLFGDVESGKTAFLRLIAHQISERFAPDRAKILLIDYRRGMLGEVSASHLIGHCSSKDMVDDALAQVCEVMRNRLPGPDITPEQLRARNWWAGPELFILIDDYDLVATSMTNPLAPLMEFLAQGRDIGLHVVIARRSGGAGRAVYEAFLQRIRDLASPGLVMSGSKEEGILLGNVKPQPQPPGRGWLVTRQSANRLVQGAWSAPRHDVELARLGESLEAHQ